MLIARAQDASAKYEYGCDLRRLYPWPGVSDPVYWGAAIASVRPGEATSPHSHDEYETFIVLSGQGRMRILHELQQVGAGDVILIPKQHDHQITNISSEQPLVFLTIFWDSPEARQGMLQMLQHAGVR